MITMYYVKNICCIVDNFRSEPFDWLYLDPKTFKELANKNGLSFEVIGTGKNYDYLAKLTII